MDADARGECGSRGQLPAQCRLRKWPVHSDFREPELLHRVVQQERPCDNGTVCGAPDWHTSVDYCIPVPEMPVIRQGTELFDANGKPNLNHPVLEAYPVIGFRASQLGHKTAMFKVLAELGYSYDTSKVLSPGPPSRVVDGGQMFDTLYEFALMKNRDREPSRWTTTTR